MENLDYIITKLEDASTPDKKNKLTALIIGEVKGPEHGGKGLGTN
jgi:hypothetical protein